MNNSIIISIIRLIISYPKIFPIHFLMQLYSPVLINNLISKIKKHDIKQLPKLIGIENKKSKYKCFCVLLYMAEKQDA